LAGLEEYQGPQAGYDLSVLLLCPQRRAGGRCLSISNLESADLQAAGNALGIIQNETVQFSTTLNTVFNLLAYVTGGTGTVICHFVQRRFKLSVKTMLVFGVVMAIMPTFWAFLGNFTNVVGFHNSTFSALDQADHSLGILLEELLECHDL